MKPLNYWMTGMFVACLCLVHFFTGAPAALASGPSKTEKALNYRVLCLYKSSEGATRSFNECLNMLGVPLHRLGMRVRYRDADAPLPSDAELSSYDAVITWFGSGEMREAAGYCGFVRKAVGMGLKFVVFENFGAYTEKESKKPVDMNVLNGAFGDIGFKYLGNWTADTAQVRIGRIDRAMCEFGIKYSDAPPAFYTQFVVADTAESQVFMNIARADLSGSTSDVAFVTPRGGMVLNGYAYFSSPDFKKRKWRINPAAYLEKALGLSGEMRLDTTTKNGKRILFTHIDGDGLANISEIDRRSLSSEIIRDRLIKAYPDMKFSVSFITGEIDPAYSKNPRLLEAARSIAVLPNVEVASHGFTHPHDWDKKIVNIKIPGYEFSFASEIEGSLDFINKNVARPEKPAKMMFWSGKCNPGREAMELVAKKGILNINGGDSKFDNEYNSSLFLRPPYIDSGDGVQVLTAACNEVIYTNLFTSNFGGYARVIETFRNTEKPARLAPMNIYFHFFSGQKKETLDALLSVVDFALKQGPEMVYASEYAEMINGFVAAKVEKTAPGVYAISGAGAVPSVRFDAPGAKLDTARCKGVAGSCEINGSTYVSLDGSGDYVVAVKEAAKR